MLFGFPRARLTHDPDFVVFVHFVFTGVNFVAANEEVQLQRLMARNNLTREEAVRRIGTQMPQAEKMKFADYLIDTTDGFEPARLQTTAVYESLMRDSAAKVN